MFISTDLPLSSLINMCFPRLTQRSNVQKFYRILITHVSKTGYRTPECASPPRACCCCPCTQHKQLTFLNLPHRLFRRDGNDSQRQATIPFKEVAGGTRCHAEETCNGRYRQRRREEREESPKGCCIPVLDGWLWSQPQNLLHRHALHASVCSTHSQEGRGARTGLQDEENNV